MLEASKKNIYFTSLGCEKNLVDSQVMLGYLGLGGFKVTDSPSSAEVIIVNTCSFIEAAKQESIEVILSNADYKNKDQGVCKALVVAGCMAQRYSIELEKELPEVDLIIGTGEYHKINKLLTALEDGKLEKKSFVEIPKFIHTEFDPRLNTSPSYMAWLKVSEGCDRNCTFCIIPTLRGKLRSRTVQSLVVEAKKLVETGVKEINIISQDLSSYGVDLDDSNNLLSLIEGMESIENLNWVRLFYYYPDELTDEIIQKIAQSKKICHYLDMPVQHFSNSVLKRMNRNITGDRITERVSKLKSEIPDIVIRTSIIVGFPGETEEDFQQLLEGVKKAEFDHLGIFRYSDEEGTPAFKLEPKVEPSVIDSRFDELFEVQSEIVESKNQNYIGKTLEVIVEGEHEETELLIKGRHSQQAPDVDGCVIINDLAGSEVQIGDIVQVNITETLGFDLIGAIVLPS
jgi:ribosomal protein S12 methylthiotransferase